jgi:CPA2 family monovalent cation:H+ antiporter-2
VLAALYIGIFLISFFSFLIAVVGFILLVSVALIYSKRIHTFYVRLESRFFYNFHDRERLEAIKNRQELAPWDAHITQFVLPMGTPVTGMTLEEMGLRERLGINIAMIKRGEHYTISTPSRFERVYPGDVLFVIGTDEQLDQFKKHIEPVNGKEPEVYAGGGDDMVLKKIRVKRNSFLDQRTIRESGIRERTNGLVVGIERNNRRILNPESNLILKEGDLLWVVGDSRLIDQIKNE